MRQLILAVPAVCLLLTSPVNPAHAADLDASWQDGIKYQWAKRRSLTLGGRIHYDIASYDDDVTPLDDDSDFRRLRASLRGQIDDWRLRADYDFGIADGWRSLYVQYRGLKRTRITLGQQNAPFSLDDLMGSNDLTFMERSLVSALSPGMLVGVAYQTWGDRWTASIGVFGDELNDQDRRIADGTSVVGRITYTPVRSKGHVLHLGLAQEFRSVDSNTGVRILTRPESRLANNRLIGTPTLSGVDDLRTTGLELMAIRNNLRFQSEYMLMTLDGGGNDADFSGGYAQVSMVLTGERYRYSGSNGITGSLQPRGNRGALEAAVRYSTLDLEDAGITGGEQTQITGSLSWYINRQLRISTNYSVFDAAPNNDGIDEDGSIIMLRLQATM